MKIYLSKSKLSETLFVAAIQALFSEVEVIEYQGGPYDPAIIKQANCLVAIPPMGQTIHVGKGVGDEIIYTKRNQMECFIVNETGFYAINEVLVNNTKDWQKEYYKLKLHENPFEFKKIGDEYGFKEIVS